jgi:hypothetical protein
MSELETPQPPIDGDPNLATEPDVETEVAGLAVDDGKGNKMVPLSALIGAKKEVKSLGKRVKELEPIAGRVTDVEGKLANVQPLLDALVTSPSLRAEAIRLANGGQPTPKRDAADPDEDPDAAEVATDLGLFLTDQVTPDVARARKILNRLDQRHGRQTDTKIGPIAGLVAGSRAEQNVSHAMRLTDTDGTPLATRESIEETVKMLGGSQSAILANPQVVDLVINNAIGLDRRKGRTPKPVDEPLYLERPGSGRSPRTESVLSAEEKSFLERSGITEKDYRESSQRLEAAASSRKAITLGRSR